MDPPVLRVTADTEKIQAQVTELMPFGTTWASAGKGFSLLLVAGTAGTP